MKSCSISWLVPVRKVAAVKAFPSLTLNVCGPESGLLLARTLFHRLSPVLFRDELRAFSHIVRSGERKVDDGRVWEMYAQSARANGAGSVQVLRQ